MIKIFIGFGGVNALQQTYWVGWGLTGDELRKLVSWVVMGSSVLRNILINTNTRFEANVLCQPFFKVEILKFYPLISADECGQEVLVIDCSRGATS